MKTEIKMFEISSDETIKDWLSKFKLYLTEIFKK